MQKEDGTLAQWTRYSAFGKEELFGEAVSPWRFANRRVIAGLLLFTHRFYNPDLRRWQTTDPLGFEDGMNLYRYVHNNPFYHRDPDGQFAFVIPLVTAVFGPGGLAAISGPTIGAIIGSAVGFTAGWVVYEINKNYDEAHEIEENKEEVERGRGGKKKYREENFPGTDKDLENNPDWRETTHPNQREAGHREFENVKTGEKIRYDKGDPNAPGHEAEDHYHRYNPDSKGNNDKYLDNQGNPVHKNSDKSHLYPPNGTGWEF